MKALCRFWDFPPTVKIYLPATLVLESHKQDLIICEKTINVYVRGFPPIPTRLRCFLPVAEKL